MAGPLVIGIVIVSHSAKLAEGVCELAEQVAHGKARLAPCGGTADPDRPTGTDAFRVLAAIESVYSVDGVLVLMDLGSAVLSAETALELLDSEKRAAVKLCAAPLVEGAVAAAALAGAGASLDEIAREAAGAMAGKTTAAAVAPTAERRVTLPNPLGLHARPAARLVRMARQFDARATLRNETAGRGSAEAGSMNSLLTLAARQGHTVVIQAEGSQASEAVSALASLLESGFGESERAAALQPTATEEREGSLHGVAASEGFGVGPLVKLHSAWLAPAAREPADPATEEGKLLAAIEAARQETRALFDWATAHTGHANAAIFDAQDAFLEDPDLASSAARMIREENSSAEAAWYTAAEQIARRLESPGGPRAARPRCGPARRSRPRPAQPHRCHRRTPAAARAICCRGSRPCALRR